MSRAFFGAFGKRCHVQIWCLRQKMLGTDEGRIFRAQSALEQLYQTFCTNTREAGGLPYINQSKFKLVWPGSRDPDERSVVQRTLERWYRYAHHLKASASHMT